MTTTNALSVSPTPYNTESTTPTTATPETETNTSELEWLSRLLNQDVEATEPPGEPPTETKALVPTLSRELTPTYPLHSDKGPTDTVPFNKLIADQCKWKQSGKPGEEVWTLVSANGTFDHCVIVAEYYGFSIQLNEFSKDYRMTFQGKPFEGGFDSFLNEIESLHVLNNIPHRMVEKHLEMWARRNKFNEIKEFLKSEQWDGYDHIADLAYTIHLKKGYETPLKDVYIRKAMIHAIALVYRPEYSNDKFRGRGVLTFIGEGRIGKTTWFSEWCPVEGYFGEGLEMNTQDKDDKLAAAQVWIGELGEVEQNLKPKDVERLKNYLTRPIDRIRVHYGKKVEPRKRRALFVATANSDRLFSDAALADRFWVLHVCKLDRISDLIRDGKLNLRQAWAQAKHFYDTGVQWWLDEEEQKQQDENSKKSMKVDPYWDWLDSKLDWDAPKTEWSDSHLVTYLKMAGVGENAWGSSRHDFRKYLLARNVETKPGRSNQTLYTVPPIKPENVTFVDGSVRIDGKPLSR